MDKPKIVCLCGSTRFKNEFIKANQIETLRGRIVLSVGLFGHADKWKLDDETKNKLDELHKRKIDLCDEILVINVKGYVGESTKKEIEYAFKNEKIVRYLEPIKEAK